MTNEPQPTYYDDAIDLRKYILIPLKRWKLIAASAILAAVAAFVVSSNITPTYESSVYLATTRLKIEVQFGTALVLLALVLSMNVVATLIRSQFRRRRQW